MLEVRNLVKSYSAKGGVTVKALDDVSVRFPETGMVFLLGRSGSGKSTLLNVSGGLDKPDSGEVIVKGRSSKDFSSSDFDSYRNTFVGFVFQEYNILNEFTVSENISLALQLQGKPADKKAVEALLEQVDLKGLGKRKPNTLSGGQKQRVAIARALIKEPEIIMADEPTGALDSTTGRQVLDTLKKLSETKLVVVVSHDREFAESYGDRIIELRDGKIVSDVSKAVSEPKEEGENVRVVFDDTLSIRSAGDLTDADIKNIAAFLRKNGGEAIIAAGKDNLSGVRRACRINDDGKKEYFRDTEEPAVKDNGGGEKIRFIKSRLPLSRAVRMGASGLKTKPIRLVFTVLLAVVAFVMFGVVSTFMLYDPNYSISEALREADYPSLKIAKNYTYISRSYRTENGKDKLESEYENTARTRFGASELAEKNKRANKYAGVFDFTDYRSGSSTSISLLPVVGDVSIPVSVTDDAHPVTGAFGFTDCGAEYMERNGFTLLGSGHYPADKTEIALPEYLASLFAGGQGGVAAATDLTGKKIRLTGVSAIPNDAEFTVSGVYSVGKIAAKYDDLKSTGNLSEKERRELKESLADMLRSSFHTVLFVSPDFYDEFGEGVYVESKYYDVEQAAGVSVGGYSGIFNDTVDPDSFFGYYTDKTVERYASDISFADFWGNPVTYAAAEGTAYLPTKMRFDAYSSLAWTLVNNAKYSAEAYALFGGEEFQAAIYGLQSDRGAQETVRSALSEWFAPLAKRNFLYSAAYYLEQTIRANGEEDASRDFLDALERVRNDLGLAGDDAAFRSTDADWATIEEFTSKPEYSGCLYRAYAEDLGSLIDGGAIDGEIRERTGLSFWDLRNNWEEHEEEIREIVEEYAEQVTGYSLNDERRFEPAGDRFLYYKDYLGHTGTLAVAGYFELAGSSDTYTVLVSEAFLGAHASPTAANPSWWNEESTDYVAPADAKYNYLLALTDNSQSEIAAALSADGAAVVYKIDNSVCRELEFFLDMIRNMQKIFLIVGIVVGVFAALMLLNFISVSISAKRKEIGILRAVGARGSDVFKIFFSEALIIALVCFAIAAVGAFFACGLIGNSIGDVVQIKLLHYGAVNVLLILGISLVVSLVATFFPVFFASKKSPVESIRAL